MPSKPSKPKTSLVPSHHFPAVRKAREALKEQALEILDEYRSAIKMAIASGKYEEGLKAYQWLLDHIPNDKGTRIFDASSDKAVQSDGPKGPLIQIGFALGGVEPPRQITPVKPDDIEGETVNDE